ncbi:hypothetical protein OHB01_27230 [Microbispora hainanensis]|uniref:Integrase n=1 Tax=Microbispora hainanensis TaxID=568844 RepID=A0ABZ1SXS1_9ACTN|nr:MULTISPECIES: hypothetical protein [Microbispora]NJP29994.1 hypothetical protein [Microbispora sp. CL1-1]
MNIILPVLPELIRLRHHELLRQAEQHRRTRQARAVPATRRWVRRGPLDLH